MAKKYKLFKVAKELNIASDTIIAFLEKKGLQVKGPNTSLTDEDYSEILEKFSIEKERADILHAKREHDKVLSEEAVASEVALTETGIEKDPVEVAAVSDKKVAKESVVAVKEEPPSKTFLEEKLEMIEKDKIERVRKRRSKLEKAKADPADKEEVTDETGKKKVAAPKKAETAADKISEKKKEKPEVEVTEKTPVSGVESESSDKKEKAKKIKKDSDKEVKEVSADTDEKKSKKDAGKKRFLSKDKFPEKHRSKRVEIPVDGSGDFPRRRKKRRKKQVVVDQQAVENTLKKTLAEMGSGVKKKRKKIKRKDNGEMEEVEQNVIVVTEFISAQDLASLMDIPIQDIIKKAIEMGMMITINQRLDLDTIQLLADEFDYAIEEEEEFHGDVDFELEEEEDKPEDLVNRSPIVTIMGHVDHGKTSLLDFIRKANVVDTEAGGITQHIGAYQVNYNDKVITFLDTPGHEAFTAMRARGANVTDIAVIVVAADDAVMPQTIEAIDHAKSAGVPMIFAVNKMDKANANPDKIFQQLADRNILVEDWGGTFQVARVSAKKGEGIEELLEKIILESEMLELKANPNRMARGVIIEAKLDKGKGAIATVLIQNGTLKKGNSFVAGQLSGKVRAMHDQTFKAVDEAGPSVPIQVLGFDSTPQAGDVLNVMKDERSARELGTKRQQIKREQEFRKHHHLTLDEISRRIQFGEVKELNIIVKGDVDGSVEALADSLMKMSNEEVAVHVVRKAVGQISEADVMLASASNAFIIGFHVRPSVQANALAESEKVDIRTYKIVYDAINDIHDALEGMLSPEIREQITGRVEIRQVFKISKIGSIAGCHVTEGKILRNNPIRLLREGVVIYEGKLSSLKRFQDDASEVKSGFECGLQIAGYNDIKEGDELETYETFEEKRTLEK